ncbi:MAG: DNRLRE domain-containing protein, partial [Thermoplasmata archaeon]|nr:DNRLRE domain-containing protein [Thermoplasmata archaeon]
MVEPDYVNVIEQSEQDLDQNIVEYDIEEPEQADISSDLEETVNLEPEILEPLKYPDPDSRLEKYYFSDFDENGDPTTSWEYWEIKDPIQENNLFSEPPIYTLASPHLIIQPDAVTGKDALIREGGPDMNDGSGGHLTVNTGSDTQGLIEFDISSAGFLDNDNITSVELNIFHSWNGAGLEPWGVYQVNDSWTEMTVTWNNQPESSNIADDITWYNGGDLTWRTWDITDIFKKWKNGTLANNGLLLRRDDGAQCDIYHVSSDGAEALRPFLSIGFTADYWANITPEGQREYGFAGASVLYNLSIENQGDLDDTYDLAQIDGGWPITFRDAGNTMVITQISVPSDSSQDFIARVDIPGGASPGDFEEFLVQATSHNDTSFNSTVNFWTQVPHDPGISDDFEGGDLGWFNQEIKMSGTNWEFGDPSSVSWLSSSYSPANCWGTNLLTGTLRNADTCLVSPYIDLAVGQQILSFYHWYRLGSDWDNNGAFMEISVDGGNWDLITPITGYPGINEQAGDYNTDCYYDRSLGWEYAECDLSAYGGNIIQVRFHLAMQGGGYPGWYVDDVYIGDLPSYRADLTPGISNTYGLLGQSVPYTMTINNTGANDDTYDLSF